MRTNGYGVIEVNLYHYKHQHHLNGCIKLLQTKETSEYYDELTQRCERWRCQVGKCWQAYYDKRKILRKCGCENDPGTGQSDQP